MTEVEFTVYGDPASQAGMRTVPIRTKHGALVMANGRPVTRQITEGSKGLRSWRQEVSDAAHVWANKLGRQLVPPLECWMEWHFLMPASRPKWAKVLGVIPKVTKPDGDKLQRAIWDSLKTGGLIPDDATITNWHGAKVEVSDGWIGVRIKLRELPSGKPPDRAVVQPALVP